MKKTTLFLLLFLCTRLLPAQILSGVSSAWNDSFAEWELFVNFPTDSTVTQEEQTEPEEVRWGNMKLRWSGMKQDDWSEWDFTLDDSNIQGTIKQKWKNDKTQWELRTYDGSIVTMRTIWGNDLTEWRITDNSTTLTLKCRWKNQLDEWIMKDPNYGMFYLYTLRSLDPRDWVIEDNTEEKISLPMKLAMVFLTVYHGSPRL